VTDAARDPRQPELPGLVLPLDPVRLATLSAPERGEVYRRLDLDRVQIAAAEANVRIVLLRKYREGE
jgi:hypothetical protein